MVETTNKIERSEIKRAVGWMMVDYAREYEGDSDIALEFLTEGRNLIEESREQEDSPGVLDNYES